MKTSKKITLWSVAFVAIVAIVLMVAAEVRATPQTKVTLCHETSSASNPWVEITVDKSSVIELPNGHHYHEGDIIPLFDYQEVTGFKVEHRDKWKIIVWLPWSDWKDGPCPWQNSGLYKCEVRVEPIISTLQYAGKNMGTTFYNAAGVGYTGAFILGNGCEMPVDIPGCMDPEAENYNPEATVDDGT